MTRTAQRALRRFLALGAEKGSIEVTHDQGYLGLHRVTVTSEGTEIGIGKVVRERGSTSTHLSLESGEPLQIGRTYTLVIGDGVQRDVVVHDSPTTMTGVLVTTLNGLPLFD